MLENHQLLTPVKKSKKLHAIWIFHFRKIISLFIHEFAYMWEKNHNNKRPLHELKKIFKDVTELYHAYTYYHHIVTCSWHSVVIIHRNLNIVANNTILNLNYCLKFCSENF